MRTYTYKGIDLATGANKKGSIDADSIKSARAKIRQHYKISVTEIKEESAKKTGGFSSFRSEPKVGLTDVAIMTRQFATLQSAHVPIDESLKALKDQVENETLRKTLGKVGESVQEGESLAEAMGAMPHIFNRLYINMVKAGETSGTLGLVLERLADFQEYQVEIRGKIFSALAYPAIMILASLGIIAYLFVSIVPKLQKVFQSLKVKLPWTTEALIAFSESLQNYWYVYIGACLLIAFLFSRWYASPKGRAKFDRFILSVPLFGGIVMRLNVSKFTKTLSTLLSSGVPIMQALDITKNITSNTVIAGVVENARVAVQEGGSLGYTIERSGEFPSLVSHMIKTGEKTGELEQMLSHVAVAYDSEVERKISALISTIEPLMIIVMGGVTVVIVIAMLVPMLSVMSQMR